MEDHKKMTHEIKQTLLELEKHASVANDKLRIFLKDLPQTDMIARIHQLNLSDDSLNFLCEGIALKTEDYEICTAVETIKKERAAKWAKTKEEMLLSTLPSNVPTSEASPRILPT
jgi:hypothetical protein